MAASMIVLYRRHGRNVITSPSSGIFEERISRRVSLTEPFPLSLPLHSNSSITYGTGLVWTPHHPAVGGCSIVLGICTATTSVRTVIVPDADIVTAITFFLVPCSLTRPGPRPSLSPLRGNRPMTRVSHHTQTLGWTHNEVQA